MQIYQGFELFLSRLCGGEGHSGQFGMPNSFLSRLCGGEDLVMVAVSQPYLSKPPMWR